MTALTYHDVDPDALQSLAAGYKATKPAPHAYMVVWKRGE